MSKWEYHMLIIDQRRLIKILNEMGAGGWEVCGIESNPTTGMVSCLFKRQL